ncbi:MAG: hypothetical protein ACR2QC_03765 [Gammaproteobacteria bacterium]
MNSYSYESLRAEAAAAGCWIDSRDAQTPRGRGMGNTNKKERVSRALSWYARSESADEADERLVFAFVAYNALYARPEYDGKEVNAKAERDAFWHKLLQTGRDEILKFARAEAGKLKEILSLQYISFLFWKEGDDAREKHEKMRQETDRAKRITARQLAAGDVRPVNLAMERIGMLRNQILHGMAAYEDSYNRKQVKACADFLHPLVGRMIAAVVRDQKQDWGKVPYPPQGYPNEFRVEVDELED